MRKYCSAINIFSPISVTIRPSHPMWDGFHTRSSSHVTVSCIPLPVQSHLNRPPFPHRTSQASPFVHASWLLHGLGLVQQVRIPTTLKSRHPFLGSAVIYDWRARRVSVASCRGFARPYCLSQVDSIIPPGMPQKKPPFQAVFHGVPGGIRTHGLQSRRLRKSNLICCNCRHLGLS